MPQILFGAYDSLRELRVTIPWLEEAMKSRKGATMSQDAYKMKVEYTPLLRQYGGNEIWAVLDKVGCEPIGEIGESAIFTVQSEELEEYLADPNLDPERALTTREREILTALKMEVEAEEEAGVMDISFD